MGIKPVKKWQGALPDWQGTIATVIVRDIKDGDDLETGVNGMFTGIVQGTAKIVSIDEKPNFRTHVVEMPEHMLDGIETGASIAHNGCCLTVTEINGSHISFDLMKETLRITNLGELKEGDVVNVERAARFNDEIGGHLMSGHIMTTADVAKILTSENNRQIWFKVQDPTLMKYILYKGFIGIDGISLTVGEVTPTRFCVHLIPETLQRTTLGKKKLGEKVNIEIDPQTQAVVDTVERVLAAKESAIKRLSAEE
jgi:riboflavin synthase